MSKLQDDFKPDSHSETSSRSSGSLFFLLKEQPFFAGFLLFSFLILLFPGFTAFSQNKVQDVFKETYSLEKSGKYAEASRLLKNIYSEDSYEINMRLGWLNYMGGFFTDSEAYYRKAIQLRRYSIEARFGLAYPLSGLGHWNAILENYLEVLEIDPKNTLASYRLASIYYGRKDFKTAEKYLEPILNFYPMDYDTVILAAWTKLNSSKAAQAKVLFQNALLLNPDDESALEGLASLK